MHEQVKNSILQVFFRDFASSFKNPCNVYLTGGACAVFYGWRETTNDIDLKIIPDIEAYEIISKIKNTLNLNLELASPDNFIPALPNWEDRSVFITTVGKVSFYHFDFYSQALAKLERGFERDLHDVHSMAAAKLIEKDKLKDLYEQIEAKLIMFPSIDPEIFRRRVEEFVQQ